MLKLKVNHQINKYRMEGAFFGSIIFEFIGSLFRWLYLFVVYSVKGKEVLSFKRVWKGKEDGSVKDDFEYGISNIFLGILVVLSIVVIIRFIV